METPAQTCVRLLAALEDLAAAEAATLLAGDFEVAVEIQGRAAPLVAYLGEHGPAVADRAFRARIAAVLRQRSGSAARLGTRIDEVREELQSTQASQHRVARIAPVYGSAPGAVAGQLSAVG